MTFNWTQGFMPATQTSAAIRLIRPILIILISLAHLRILNEMVWINGASSLDFNNWMTVYLKAGVAKSGVPLLSLISGYLAVLSLERYGYFNLQWRKAKRLIWPLFWSNLLFIILITYPTQAQDANFRPDLEVYPFNWMGWFQATFAFYRIPANEPLYFLKDLFTCFLLLPLLVLLARVRYLNLAVVAWMAYKCIYLKSAFLFHVFPLWFMRFDIIFAFYVGILLFFWNRDLVIKNDKVNLGLVTLFLVGTGLACAMYVALAKPEHLVLFLWTGFLVKVCSVAGCVGLMSLLVNNPGRVSRFFSWLSPFAYTLFLTHLFTFTFFNRTYQHFLGTPEFYGLEGILYILLTIATAVAVSIALKTSWSWLGLKIRSRA
jgi:hypothetical protein